MSKKNRAQHSTPRRHGDRNVQTRYSGKHQCGDDPIRESSLHNCPGRACGGACHEADEAVCMDGIGLTLIPEVKVKIREPVLHGTGGAAEVETGFEEEESNGEEE